MWETCWSFASRYTQIWFPTYNQFLPEADVSNLLGLKTLDLDVGDFITRHFRWLWWIMNYDMKNVFLPLNSWRWPGSSVPPSGFWKWSWPCGRGHLGNDPAQMMTVLKIYQWRIWCSLVHSSRPVGFSWSCECCAAAESCSLVQSGCAGRPAGPEGRETERWPASPAWPPCPWGGQDG